MLFNLILYPHCSSDTFMKNFLSIFTYPYTFLLLCYATCEARLILPITDSLQIPDSKSFSLLPHHLQNQISVRQPFKYDPRLIFYSLFPLFLCVHAHTHTHYPISAIHCMGYNELYSILAACLHLAYSALYCYYSCMCLRQCHPTLPACWYTNEVNTITLSKLLQSFLGIFGFSDVLTASPPYSCSPSTLMLASKKPLRGGDLTAELLV